MTPSIADLAVIALYVIVVLFIGFRSSKSDKDDKDNTENFILAGRKVTLPFFVGTLVATWYGSILGVGEFVYNSGILAWVCFALPYYISATLFALLIAKKIRNSNILTIPDQISSKYGNIAGTVASVIVLIITLPASYILMLGVIIDMFTGWGLVNSIILGAMISLVYIYTGGLKADIRTNFAQFIVMYVGFAALLFFSYSSYGSVFELTNKLPETHLDPTGGNSWQYVIVWFIISLQTFIDPGFHQRCAAAKTPKVARNGILISVLFWIIFDAMTLSTGLYAKAFFVIDNPLMAYPTLAESVLPPIWKGVFITALIATVMSTLDSYAFLSATTIGNDLLKKMRSLQHISTQKLTQLGLVLTAVLSILLATALPSVIDLIYKTSSIAVPGLLLPLLISFSSKYQIQAKHASMVMLAGSSASLIWMVLLEMSIGFAEGIEAMLPGILVSLIFTSVFTKRVNYEQ
jgi:SSS family solute:Na+ symporter